MKNAEVVQDLEADYSLNQNTPDLTLLEVLFLLLLVDYLLIEIPIVSELHDDAVSHI